MADDLVQEIQRFYPQIYLASPRALAAHLGVAASTLSAAIARLERLGYITSSAPESDKRQRELRLTAKGAEAMASTSVLDVDRVRALLELLQPRERKAAVRGLALLAAAARKMRRSGGCHG